MDSLIVKLAEGVTVGLTGGITDELAAETVGCSVSIFAAMCTEITFMVASSEETLMFGSEACSCWPTTACDRRALQAWMPSYHVRPRFAFPAPLHFPNQEPPRLQQLLFPDL